MSARSDRQGGARRRRLAVLPRRRGLGLFRHRHLPDGDHVGPLLLRPLTAALRMSDAKRMRLDAALVARGLAPSRARARDAILRGAVTVDGAPETKPGRMVAADAAIAVDDPAGGYVSRAALKLVAALDAFGFDPAGLTALDLGASTGGFTQVLLRARRGARHRRRCRARAASSDARHRPARHAARRPERARSYARASRRTEDRRDRRRSELHLAEARAAAGAALADTRRVGRVPGEAAIRGRARSDRQGRHREGRGARGEGGARISRRGWRTAQTPPRKRERRWRVVGHNPLADRRRLGQPRIPDRRAA